jgi:hypothetical protein
MRIVNKVGVASVLDHGFNIRSSDFHSVVVDPERLVCACEFGMCT